MQGQEESNLLTLYSDVRATSVRWLWYPYIAIGKITLLQGDPGDGKSTMMMSLISEVSNGGLTPDGKEIGRPQRVIYQCSEDGVADTIKPRLERCGADCRNIAFINEEICGGLTLDDERIRQAIISFRPRLVVIDPIQAYLGNDSDLLIAGRARKLMQRLGMWASVYDCAVVLIGHLNKKEGSKDLYEEYVELLLNTVERCIAIRPCSKDNPNAVRWGRLKDSRWSVSAISCRGLAKTLFDIMEWEEDTRYRFRGEYVGAGENKMLLFQLDEPEMIKTEEITLPPQEPEQDGTEEEKEEIVIKKKMMVFPAAWADSFGRPITSLACVNMLEQEHYAGNWDILRPAKEVEDYNLVSSEELKALMQEAERIMEGWENTNE